MNFRNDQSGRMEMKKRLFYAAVAALLLLSLVSCGRDGLPPDESSGGPVPNSSAEVTWEAPDETLSASLAKLLSKHSSKGWYHHIGKADVFRQDGVVRAEITLKEESTKYASASVMLSGFFDTEQMDAFSLASAARRKNWAFAVPTLQKLENYFIT